MYKRQSYIYNSRSGKKERVSRLFQMHSNKQNPVEVIGAGDIGAGVGFKDIHTGDTLCDETAPVSYTHLTEKPITILGSMGASTIKSKLGLSPLADAVMDAVQGLSLIHI